MFLNSLNLLYLFKRLKFTSVFTNATICIFAFPIASKSTTFAFTFTFSSAMDAYML